MNYPLRCRCGTVQGEVDPRKAAGRAFCYCKDCQAYARYLGAPEILNGHGGTEIIATHPSSVRFTAGAGALACVTLTEKGPLRWYATCCRTPIGNTARTRKIAYVGLVRACLPGPDAALNERFRPLDVALNTESARGNVEKTPLATFLALGRIAKMMVGARLTGTYTVNPFFSSGTDQPIRKPHGVETPAPTDSGPTT